MIQNTLYFQNTICIGLHRWHDVKVGPGLRDQGPRDSGTRDPGPPSNFKRGTPGPH